MTKIPVSVIIVTKNEERRIGPCLRALQRFDELIVADSCSRDQTQGIARAQGAAVYNFVWNGRYPKKRQWCLDNIRTRHNYIFFVDADENVTPDLCDEIAALDFKAAGYFVSGQYIYRGRPLRFGLRNNKLALFHKGRFVFPVVDDLDIAGMGEIEGHYQPLLKPQYAAETIGRLRRPLLHDACDDAAAWTERHERYALWEAEVNRRGAWPGDPRLMKRLFKALPVKAELAFAHSYILKLGMLDGERGLDFALSRYRYYKRIAGLQRAQGLSRQ